MIRMTVCLPLHCIHCIPSGDVLRMPPKKDDEKDEKTTDYFEAAGASVKKTDDEIHEAAVENQSHAVPLLTKATYPTFRGLPATSPSSSSLKRKSKSSTATKASKAVNKAEGRPSRFSAAGSRTGPKKKKRSRAVADDDSDEDDDVVATKDTKAPKVDQEKVYNAFMKANSLVAVPSAPYVSGHCYFNAIDYSRQCLLQPAVAQTAPARQLRRVVSLVQRSAAYLAMMTAKEALPRDKARNFGAVDVSTWKGSCHEVWAVKPPEFGEVQRYVGDFEAFSTLTSGEGKPRVTELNPRNAAATLRSFTANISRLRLINKSRRGLKRGEKKREGEEKREGRKERDSNLLFLLGFLVVAGALTNFHVQSTISKF